MTSVDAMSFVLCLVAALMVCRPILAELNCADDVHANCYGESLYISKSEHIFFSDEFLTEHCSDILEDIDCKSNYLQVCNHEYHHVFVLLTKGIKGLFSELCNETSALREGYRQHRACFENSSQLFRSCVFSSLPIAQQALDNFIDSDDGNLDDEQKKVKGLCILQKELRTCSFNAVKTSCSDGAAMYLETLISRAIQDLVEEVC